MTQRPRLLSALSREATRRRRHASIGSILAVFALCVALIVSGSVHATPGHHAVASASAWAPAEHDTVSFAVVADMPQTNSQAPRAQAVLRWIAQQPHIDFIVHLGDLRTTSEPCSDSLFASREALLNATPAPLIFVPGQNDWVTCATAPGGGDPVERLDALRDSFFSGAMSLGEPGLRLIRQSELPAFRPYRENTRWIAQQVVFATLNVPSGNNHFTDAGGRNGEYEDREVATRDWISRALTDARRRRAKALVFFFQADPIAAPSVRRTRSGLTAWFGGRREYDGYAALRRDLRAAAEAFAGPVLIITTVAASPMNGQTNTHQVAAQKLPHVLYAEPLLHARNGKPLHNLLHLQVETPSADPSWLKVSWRTRRGADTPAFHAIWETVPLHLDNDADHISGAPGNAGRAKGTHETRPVTSAAIDDMVNEGTGATLGQERRERKDASMDETGTTAGINNDDSAVPPFPVPDAKATQDITGAPVYDDGSDGWAGLPEEPHTLTNPGSVLGDISRPILLPLPPQTTSPLGAPAK